MSSEDVEEELDDIKFNDIPVEDSLAEAFENLFWIDDRKQSDKALQTVASMEKYPSIPSKFHSLIEVWITDERNQAPVTTN